MSETVLVERTGSVAHVILNRPEVLNAFNLDMGERLHAAIKELASDPALRVLVLRGAGRAFCAGGDIKAMKAVADRPAFFQEISRLVHDSILMIRQMPATVMAALPGPTSGVAFGLVCSCDLRLASDTATFHAGTTRLGLTPNGGLTYFLPRLIGRGRASRLILTAEKIDAQQAQDWGLVDRVVPSDSLRKEISAWCERLTQAAPGALGSFKELIRADDSVLAAQLDREREAIRTSAGSADFNEGITAFLEKRTPHFTGK